MDEQRSALRQLPSIGKLLETEEVQRLVEQYGRPLVVTHLRNEIAEHRQRLRDSPLHIPPTPERVSDRVRQRITACERSSALRPVINATGILLHTGLGRAPLAEQAVRAIDAVACGYASVELDLESGSRGRRVRAVEDLLCELTGAEAALVVNNNAAATVLALSALAAGREVVVSRGELIEIGGQFRLPEIMTASGAILREVGTTNKTRTSDYADAIGEATGALLLVHTSNYVVVGFTEQVPLVELAALARQHRLPVIHDIGSGALIDFAQLGFHNEPVARQSVEQGADIVLFSGDKLLGGPQCGVIVGRREAVATIGRHPLARAMRVDKLTLAGLAATLELYRDPDRAMGAVPLLRLLSTSPEELSARAQKIATAARAAAAIEQAEVIEDHAYLGGGSLPTQQQPTFCVAITSRTQSATRLARALRTSRPAVVGRIRSERLLLDLRTIFPEQDSQVIEAVHRAAQP